MNIPRTARQIVAEIQNVLRSPPLAIWAAYLFLLPVYIFTSGLPQPGDLLILLLVPASFIGWNGRMARASARPLRALAAFILWGVVLNYAWMIILGKFGLFGKDTFLLVPIFYIYNAMILLAVLVLHARYGDRFLWLTLHMVLITVVTQVLLSFVVSGGTHRQTVLFNNPNQLGLYALLSANILAFGRRRMGFGTLKSSVGLMCCLYLALLSASKAALVGAALLFAVSVLSNPRTILLVGLAVLGLLSFPNPLTETMERSRDRLTEKQDVGFFNSRGYDRIWNHKEYWVIGAGEGGLSRFADTSVIGDHELHSSAGTLFFCYGLVGVVLFASFLLRVVEGSTVRSAMLLLPALAYSLAHQGLRFTLFWILIGVFIGLKKHMVPGGMSSLGTS
ncbi:MAG: hypothetical protein R3B48_21250 [Kofleriaceae bacterium]